MDSKDLKKYLQTLSYTYDALNGPKLEIVICGAVALLFMQIAERTQTQDIDLLAPPELPDDWINTSASFLWKSGLPDGFYKRCTKLKLKQASNNLKFLLTSRLDQIHFKLYAAVDEIQFGLNLSKDSGKHLQDLRFLKPKIKELNLAFNWCLKQDHPENVKEKLIDLLKSEGWGDAARKI